MGHMARKKATRHGQAVVLFPWTGWTGMELVEFPKPLLKGEELLDDEGTPEIRHCASGDAGDQVGENPPV